MSKEMDYKVTAVKDGYNERLHLSKGNRSITDKQTQP